MMLSQICTEVEIMSDSMTKIYARVIKKRLDSGERFETIILDYPKLTKDEISKLRDIIGT